MTIDRVTSLIDLNRYPIIDLSHKAAQALIIECQKQLEQSGACCLSGFIKPHLVASLVNEVKPLIPQAFYNIAEHNVYFKPDDLTVAEDHPTRQKVRTAQKTLAYDLIPESADIYQLYNWPPLREFIAAVLGLTQLYLPADPLAALNIMIMDAGDGLGWHYDRADFVTSLLLQPSAAGGVFEYVPHLRRPEDENYVGLGRLLADEPENVIAQPGEAGMLMLFAGYYSIHRVTPVQGEIPRIIAILSYVNQPDVVFSEAARVRFYGRASSVA